MAHGPVRRDQGTSVSPRSGVFPTRSNPGSQPDSIRSHDRTSRESPGRRCGVQPIPDAEIVRRWCRAGLDGLAAAREEIDALNVYPVPDGDTGTNMLLTQRAVSEAVAGVDGAPFAQIGETAARAALMGARGNSGVILSQALRGLCARLCRGDAAEAEDLAEALGFAHQEARRAIAEPVEGTMLSVLRDAADAAMAACRRGASLGDVAAAAR
jgi:uncharacterized protein